MERMVQRGFWGIGLWYLRIYGFVQLEKILFNRDSKFPVKGFGYFL